MPPTLPSRLLEATRMVSSTIALERELFRPSLTSFLALSYSDVMIDVHTGIHDGLQRKMQQRRQFSPLIPSCTLDSLSLSSLSSPISFPQTFR